MLNLSGKRVLVSGGTSMIGGCAYKSLYDRGAYIDPVPHVECDLLDYNQTISRFLRFKPDYCLHLAGFNGSIGFNKDFPADIYYRTVQMGLNVLHAARETGVKKVVSVITSCAYPDLGLDAVLHEKDFWNGLPHPSVECHGFAKRTLAEFSRQLSKQYDLKAVSVILNNCYGPLDNFDLQKTKVVGAFVRKFVEAADRDDPEVVCWGTGNPRREVLFCADAGEAVVRALESYDDCELPINIGHGTDVSIKELAELTAELADYKGRIVWDTTKQDGQMRKLLDSSRMRELLQFEPKVSLRDGIRTTINWYRKKDEV